ncbi:MAG: D-tyrosyl-tRNA(Tyr) deacylase [Oxalobacteraceae bacterium]|nr:D-tyrosyl-tRNA(Tyr) deacylase [Oxalobacteraceae bacterium]
MIGLLQRVSEASVRVDGTLVGQIGQGLLVLLCAERGDTRKEADALLNKLLGIRVFSDAEGKMNLNLGQVNGGLLLVPQFTLAADTRSGTRPSFTPAAPPAVANELFDYTVQSARQAHPQIETGRFGADMKVALVNDGPVTFWLHVAPAT